MAHIVRSLYWAIGNIVRRSWAAVESFRINNGIPLGTKNKDLQGLYCVAEVCKTANNSGGRNLKYNVKIKCQDFFLLGRNAAYRRGNSSRHIEYNVHN